ncbi:MAG: AmmeMemoRadiSam system radical SAM enzyme [Nanoarchaeota archaeon]
MHEALLYKQLEKKKVRCTACKQHCLILPGQTGICGVRQNKEGKLYLLVYGKASAVNTDPIEKKPLFHFLPGSKIFSLGTVGCNFSCSFCQNWDLSQSTKELKKRLAAEGKHKGMDVALGELGYELPPEKIVEICGQQRIPSIAYTYNEPAIFFEYLYDTAKLSHAQGIKNVLVSNGYESDIALEKLRPYIAAMNIDLKSFSETFYTKLCKAKLKPIVETIKKAHEFGIWIEITTLIIPGQNDSDKELGQIAQFIASIDTNIPWHVTAFHPDYKMLQVPTTTYASLMHAHGIGKKAGLKFVYVGNILDEEYSTTYCPNCQTPLVRRNGFHITVKDFSSGACTKCGEKIPGIWE